MFTGLSYLCLIKGEVFAVCIYMIYFVLLKVLGSCMFAWSTLIRGEVFAVCIYFLAYKYISRVLSQRKRRRDTSWHQNWIMLVMKWEALRKLIPTNTRVLCWTPSVARSFTLFLFFCNFLHLNWDLISLLFQRMKGNDRKKKRCLSDFLKIRRSHL